MKYSTLADLWQQYVDTVLKPAAAGPVQINETHKAFYTGAWAVFSLLMHVLEPGQQPTTKDLEKVDKLFRELTDFQEQVSGI